jgi:agmatinase
MMRAYGGRGRSVVHIDAHLDFRDEVSGVHDGLSADAARVGLPWVTSMFQVGLRGVVAPASGTWTTRGVQRIRVRAEELHETGVTEILARAGRFRPTHQPGHRRHRSRNCPGINGMGSAGSRTTGDNLLRESPWGGLSADMVEIAQEGPPEHDESLASRLILNLIGAMAHTGQIGR